MAIYTNTEKIEIFNFTLLSFVYHISYQMLSILECLCFMQYLLESKKKSEKIFNSTKENYL